METPRNNQANIPNETPAVESPYAGNNPIQSGHSGTDCTNSRNEQMELFEAPADDSSSGLLSDGKTEYNWPFGVERGPIQGFLRSLIPERDALIQHYGNGVATYPPYQEGGPPRLIQPDATKYAGYSCSGADCNKAPLGCVHAWEHRFRGDLKDKGYLPPIKTLQVREKGDVPYEHVVRYLARPNAKIGQVTSRWLEAQARTAMPKRVRVLLADLVALLRDRDEQRHHQYELKRPVGRPPVDLYDIAMLAVLRMADGKGYDQLDFESDVLSALTDEEGMPLMSSRFKFTRVNEAMTGYSRSKKLKDPEIEERRLTRLLERMRDWLLPFFSEITDVAMCDGMVLSTAQSDNARRNRLTSEKTAKLSAIQGAGEEVKVVVKKRVRAVQTTAHLMYEPRFGAILAFRLTFHQRGIGSGEAPQFPYLLRTTLAVMKHLNIVMADMAYGSDRNHLYCLNGKVWLVCALKNKQFQKDTKYLSKAQAAVIRERNSADNALFRQLIPFRNLVEACNSALRQYTFPYLISQPDRKRLPLTIAEKLKENPNKAEAELPEAQEERDLIIETQQFVSRACLNEMLCRQIVSLLRAIVKAEHYYQTTVRLAYQIPFQHRPEDIEFSVLRPRIDDSFAA